MTSRFVIGNWWLELFIIEIFTLGKCLSLTHVNLYIIITGRIQVEIKNQQVMCYKYFYRRLGRPGTVWIWILKGWHSNFWWSFFLSFCEFVNAWSHGFLQLVIQADVLSGLNIDGFWLWFLSIHWFDKMIGSWFLYR